MVNNVFTSFGQVLASDVKSLATLAALVLLAPLAPGAARADSTPFYYFGPQVSSLGAGLEVGARFNDYIGLRVGANGFVYSFKQSSDDIHYDFDVRLASAGAILDLHPFGNGFRLSGGVRYGANRVDLKAKPDGFITVGGTTYSAADAGAVEGDLKLNRFAPYAGFGYQGHFMKDRLMLALDLGVLFQGRPNVHLEGTGILRGDPSFEAAVRREEQDVEDKLLILSYYPVIALTLSYRF